MLGGASPGFESMRQQRSISIWDSISSGPGIGGLEPTRVFELETVRGGPEGKEATVWLNRANQSLEELPMCEPCISLES